MNNHIIESLQQIGDQWGLDIPETIEDQIKFLKREFKFLDFLSLQRFTDLSYMKDVIQKVQGLFQYAVVGLREISVMEDVNCVSDDIQVKIVMTKLEIRCEYLFPKVDKDDIAVVSPKFLIDLIDTVVVNLGDLLKVYCSSSLLFMAESKKEIADVLKELKLLRNFVCFVSESKHTQERLPGCISQGSLRSSWFGISVTTKASAWVVTLQHNLKALPINNPDTHQIAIGFKVSSTVPAQIGRRKMTMDSQVQDVATTVAATSIATTSRMNAPPVMEPEEKPKKFAGINFKRWQKKTFFYVTTLCLQRFTIEEAPEVPKGTFKQERFVIVEAWKHSDFLCRNYILSGLQDDLYNVYSGTKTTKELWGALERKYKTEYAGTKKFFIARFLKYKMIESKSVISQV
ncbi:putative phosphoserine aminotransferase, chloroplastic-like [Capsicum annuum]|nr:putative phosphoserine aminotransferase, chloroplastic-like [Capsicum annuum]